MISARMNNSRVRKARNELTARSYKDHAYPTTAHPVTLVYDLNGNLTDDGEKYQYVYNAFGQLVTIYDTGLAQNAAVYTYNGLGQRISEQLDCNDSGNTGVADGAVDSNDPVFYIAVDPQGRRVATFRNTDTYPKETFFYHANGVRGPSFTGGVQLRDREKSLSDPTLWATATAAAARAERFYYCTDQRGNVACLVDSTGNMQEQYRYSQSGVPYGIPKGNMDSTGTVTGGTGGADLAIMDYAIAHSYEARADLDLSGTVTSADRAILVAANGLATGRGKLSVAGVGSSKAIGQGELFGNGYYAISITRCYWVSVGDNILLLGWQLGPPGEASCTEVDTSCQKCKFTTTASAPFTSPPTYPGDISPTLLYGLCDVYAIGYPAAQGDGCSMYPPTYTYRCANAACFCNCAGNSSWMQYVRACLLCMYVNGVDAGIAHSHCYASADQIFGRSWSDVGMLAECYDRCTHRSISHVIWACIESGFPLVP